MLGRNGNIAYVRYDSHGRIVPGGPIISAKRPSVGLWQPVSFAIGNSVTSNSLRAFIRIDAYGRVVPSSLLLLSKEPSTADSGTSWLEINATYVPYVPTTTTTTTTAIPISTTTTTTIPISTTSTTSTSTTLTPTTSTTSTSTTTTTTTTISFNTYPVIPDGGNACYAPGTNVNIGGNIATDSTIYGNFSGSGFSSGSLIYVRYVNNTSTFVKLFTVNVGGQSAQASSSQLPC